LAAAPSCVQRTAAAALADPAARASEWKGEAGGVTVSTTAHHPTEVMATLAAQRYPIKYLGSV
jgi:UDP-N-acetylmuramate-alanine ligase